MVRIREGDNVIDTRSDTRGVVKALYPELNLAVVNVGGGELRKCHIDNLMIIEQEAPDPREWKKDGLLDKIKGKFRGRYD